MEREREAEVVSRAQQGCQRSTHLLIQENMKLVRAIARKLGRKMDFDDAVSEGIIGLINSIPRFDCDKGVRFNTYARYHVADAIRQASQRASLVRIPRSKKNHKHGKVAAKVYREHGAVTIAALMREGLSSTDATEILTLHEHERSASYNDIENFSNIPDDIGNVEDAIDLAQRRALLNQAKESLNSRERHILEARAAANDDPLTLGELGKIYGIGGERVRQIEEKALSKLMRRLEEMGILHIAA